MIVVEHLGESVGQDDQPVAGQKRLTGQKTHFIVLCYAL
jgi:hypothetical protein